MAVSDGRNLETDSHLDPLAIDIACRPMDMAGGAAVDAEPPRKTGSGPSSAGSSSPRGVWTVWADYYATGEGRTWMARIAHADDSQAAIADFGRAFDPFFAAGAQACEGVVDNEVTGLLFSHSALVQARRFAGRAHFELQCRFHFNRA